MQSIQCFEHVLQNHHDAGILSFCSDICDWNEEIILQFYATLHISGDPADYSSWALDWMTENSHYEAPANELLGALPLPIPQPGAQKL